MGGRSFAGVVVGAELGLFSRLEREGERWVATVEEDVGGGRIGGSIRRSPEFGF